MVITSAYNNREHPPPKASKMRLRGITGLGLGLGFGIGSYQYQAQAKPNRELYLFPSLTGPQTLSAYVVTPGRINAIAIPISLVSLSYANQLLRRRKE